MLVESCCQAILAEILPSLSTNRLDYAIEIGCGTFAFYCELFDKLGLKTIAVEPLPVNNLRKLCFSRDFPLVEACITECDGLIDLYIGNYLGEQNLNLNSTNPKWWGVTSTVKKVESMTLKTLINKFSLDQIICLKIDIEGAEFSVINQLSSLSETLIPKVIMFEYGGGGTYGSREGGWAEEFLKDTLNIIALLPQLGYTMAIKIDSEEEAFEKIIDLKNEILDADNIFEPRNIYGNIIALHGSSLISKDIINNTCKDYRGSQVKAPSLEIAEPLTKRLYIKLRQMVFR